MDNEGYKRLIKQVKTSICQIIVIDNKTGSIVSGGSGFIFKQKDLVATCNHVVSYPNCKILVKFPTSDFLEAILFITNQIHDLALLKLKPGKLPKEIKPLLPGNDSIEEGEKIVFMGYPLRATIATTHQGIISAILEDATGIRTFQIDGTINSGNSGSPLIKLDGGVIGVVNAVRRERNDLLKQVESLRLGTLRMHEIDLIEILQSIIKNLQLGIGYAVPVSYMPEIPKGKERKS